MVATTLTVVSCLHRHASLDSMREVETVQPLVFASSRSVSSHPPIFGRTLHLTPLSTSGNGIIFQTRAAVRSRN
jgi:hypothetical protein